MRNKLLLPSIILSLGMIISASLFCLGGTWALRSEPNQPQMIYLPSELALPQSPYHGPRGTPIQMSDIGTRYNPFHVELEIRGSVDTDISGLISVY